MRLHDLADGVRGHFCIGRYVREKRCWEFYNKGKWVSAGELFIGRDVAKAKLAELKIKAGEKWQHLRTPESRRVERLLLAAGFQQVDAYRYNRASLRVRVIDPRFRGMRYGKRITMVERVLDQLPESTQGAILFLPTLTPEEVASQKFWNNAEFDDPRDD